MSDPLFRIYEPHEIGEDGYPRVWHRIPAEVLPGNLLKLERDEAQRTGISRALGVKDVVRAQAGHRCIRCGHPYTPGCGEWEAHPNEEAIEDDYVLQLFDMEVSRTGKPPRNPLWSPCDEHCTHKCYDERKRLTVRVHRNGQPATIPQPDDIAGELAREYEGVATVQAAWRILTVHHLNGRKHDLRWWNLTSLCQICHLVIQNKVTMERVYPLEHSPWFRPFAAGWYSYAYEGVERTREEVMADLDRLLALERMA
jgi:hypothetical protein